MPVHYYIILYHCLWNFQDTKYKSRRFFGTFLQFTVQCLTARRASLPLECAGQEVSPGKGTAHGPSARQASLPFGRAGQDASPGKGTAHGPSARRVTKPGERTVRARCSCPGIHPARHIRGVTKPGRRSDPAYLQHFGGFVIISSPTPKRRTG